MTDTRTIPTHEAFHSLTLAQKVANREAQLARTDERDFVVECAGVETTVRAAGIKAAAIAFAKTMGRAYDGVSEGVDVSLRTGETRFVGTIAGRKEGGCPPCFDVRPAECKNIYSL